ncbi:Transketolase [Candidatus Trichorickettsia mobilis]|uniref:Transketolase n=1 Tax=Candidatus Trichorickettsia mobilis TaxID=1346319 RepID=A0ABZ0URD2_9RICK|nr:transketolase [Candidatus Trichorickettsia mobilis]WPY00603.1 Transketolase [Candidatus Trichorickettsia mobilis]
MLTKDSYLKLSNCIRVLAADAVEHAKSGHPGMPLGMADVMTSLAFDFLRFNPNDPLWFNRDRLVLSAGHGSMLLYAFYYLTGYTNFTIFDLKNFRKLHSKTPGHPEYDAYQAIETTTGPLGQGFANAVGMAIAAKKYQHVLGNKISNYKIYCIVGDGCLMEGISYEAASLAGHLGLDNLIVLFDDNQISIDGKTSLAVSEDHLGVFTALGWGVNAIDGHDFTQISSSLNQAQNTNKPQLIACRTLIAKGCTNKAGSETAHGSPLGGTEIKLLKTQLQMPDAAFEIPEELRATWKTAWQRNKSNYETWQNHYAQLSPTAQEYLAPVKINTDFLNNIQLATQPESTRVSSGRVIQELLKMSTKVICGSADLSFSNNIKNSLSVVITKDDFSGNFIHYGVREHAMAAIMNGLALSGFLPIGGTFFVFVDYMKPAVRLSAMMRQQVIYIMTHDSIGVGEDGATHQPIEQLAGMRAIPNLQVLRPADCAETIECWQIAISDHTRPHMLVLTRQNVPQIKASLDWRNTSLGAYVISAIAPQLDVNSNFDVCIFATGSEVQLALNAAETLTVVDNLKVQVISIPCFELFFRQDQQYINSIILKSTKLCVAIEAGCAFGWHQIIGINGIFFGINQFGVSAPAEVAYEHFTLTTENIVNAIKTKLCDL